MTEHWQDSLNETERGSGDLSGSLRQARDGCAACDLSYYALLAFEGPDAESFLHGQLSSDVLTLPQDRCLLSTYNSPKGRVLAAMLLWRNDNGFLVQLPAVLAEPIRRRLSMYVLRSKVAVSDASGRFVRIGIGGPRAAEVLAAAGLQLPDGDRGIVRSQALQADMQRIGVEYAIRLDAQRFELLAANADAARALWRVLLARGAHPASPDAWRWLTLRSGIAEIVPETQDQFVAQMLNYELIGGISFTKGCYPGQEIVARAQYRGEIKRRTLAAHTVSSVEPTLGQGIFSESSPQSAIGYVVGAAPSPEGGHDLLACLFLERSRDELHLGDLGGPRLELAALPYELPLDA